MFPAPGAFFAPSGATGQFGETTTPQGCSPTLIDLMTFSSATSTTEMSLELPLVVIRYFWSGVKAICQTRWPTSR